MDLSDERKPLLTPQEGSTMYLNDDFSLKEVTEQQEDIQEKTLSSNSTSAYRLRKENSETTYASVPK